MIKESLDLENMPIIFNNKVKTQNYSNQTQIIYYYGYAAECIYYITPVSILSDI